MNSRKRFAAIMHYQPRDRFPLWDFNFWDETLPLWHRQSLPQWVNHQNSDDFFGTPLRVFGLVQTEQAGFSTADHKRDIALSDDF